MRQLNKTKILIPASLLTVIILVSVFFHYTIHIADALTLEAIPEYEIHISIWRIIFEPVLGVLLFFNRSFYALEEFIFVLYWVLAIFILYSIIKSISIKNGNDKKSFIIRQLVNFPIIIGLWFTLFIIIIFIPLPNNTIINNAPGTILVTTHSHSEYSHDGLISQKGLWKWHKRNGFDAFYITEHNNHNKTLNFVHAQRNNKFPIEPLIMCGEEFSGSNHLSLLGLKSKFSTKGFSDSAAIESARASNGAVIVNHWFDGEHMSLEYYKTLGVDGFEIENTATDRTYDRKVYEKIKLFCENNNLIINGGVDFHGYGNVCSLWNAFEIQGWHNLDPVSKEDAILNVIKTRDQSKLKVLLYKDRSFYSKKYLFLSPVFTFFNYFRTLNVYQILSWLIWILFFSILLSWITGNPKLTKMISPDRLIPIKGLISAIFMLGLGMDYYSRIKNIEGFTEMYGEYSRILFIVGSIFLIYSGIIIFFRIIRKKHKQIPDLINFSNNLN